MFQAYSPLFQSTNVDYSERDTMILPRLLRGVFGKHLFFQVPKRYRFVFLVETASQVVQMFATEH